MPVYQYKARTKSSEVVLKTIEAESKPMAVKILLQQKLTPISINEVREKKNKTGLFGPPKPRIKKTELIMFTRQLSSIINAGLSLIDSLELLQKQMSPRAAPIIGKVIDDIKCGNSLSESFSKHPKIFDDVYVNMIKVGESGGILTEVLERMASLFEYTEENRKRIKSALRYPKIVLSIMVMAFIAIVMLIVPKFSSIFNSFGATLPLPTRILIGTNNAFQNYWYIFLPISVISFFAFKYWRKRGGQLIVDRFMLKLPVFGQLTLKSELSRFSRFFSSLYRSGITVSEGLDMSARIVDNKVISSMINQMRTSALQGQALTAPLKESKVFPELAIQMISVGENTGSISDMFERLSAYYEREVDYTIKNLTSYIEPFLIVGLGAMVLLIAMGVFLPMWNMMNVFKGKI